MKDVSEPVTKQQSELEKKTGAAQKQLSTMTAPAEATARVSQNHVNTIKNKLKS